MWYTFLQECIFGVKIQLVFRKRKTSRAVQQLQIDNETFAWFSSTVRLWLLTSHSWICAKTCWYWNWVRIFISTNTQGNVFLNASAWSMKNWPKIFGLVNVPSAYVVLVSRNHPSCLFVVQMMIRFLSSAPESQNNGSFSPIAWYLGSIGNAITKQVTF